MIEVKNLKKGFSGKSVLNGVDAVMEAGNCNLIIGSSGNNIISKFILDIYISTTIVS